VGAGCGVSHKYLRPSGRTQLCRLHATHRSGEDKTTQFRNYFVTFVLAAQVPLFHICNLPREITTMPKMKVSSFSTVAVDDDEGKLVILFNTDAGEVLLSLTRKQATDLIDELCEALGFENP